MILAGIFPAVGAILATLPSAVLGGCTIMMFGTIVISGLQMIENADSAREISQYLHCLSAKFMDLREIKRIKGGSLLTKI